jgi:hypothetical protein
MGIQRKEDWGKKVEQTMENSTHGNEGSEHFQETHFCSFFKQKFFMRSWDMPLRWMHTKFEQNRTEDVLYRSTDSTVHTLK